MVSVFEGQLTRTWFYQPIQRKHVINLYHDTITGVRSAMLDFQEVAGSIGTSSLLMESKGHRIFFTVEDLPGYIEIKRAGWTSFSYTCVVNDKKIPESTQLVAAMQDDVFRVKIIDTTFTQDETNPENLVAWYSVKSTRIRDGTSTIVHRRFREFAEFNSQIKQNFKGHHLRSILPPLPEKTLKVTTDHRDPNFIKERCARLDIFLVAMIAVPHVSDMICTKAFLGLMEQVREFSLTYNVPTLGMSLLPCDRLADNTPAIVGVIQKPELCEGVLPGDTISKINGVQVAGTSFQGVVARIKMLPRPIIIHFIQVMGSTLEEREQLVAKGSPVRTTNPVEQKLPSSGFAGDEDELIATVPVPNGKYSNSSSIPSPPSSTFSSGNTKQSPVVPPTIPSEDGEEEQDDFISGSSATATKPDKPQPTIIQPLGWD
eukprot:gene10952-14706_t